jgi:hypothetical protein
MAKAPVAPTLPKPHRFCGGTSRGYPVQEALFTEASLSGASFVGWPPKLSAREIDVSPMVFAHSRRAREEREQRERGPLQLRWLCTVLETGDASAALQVGLEGFVENLRGVARAAVTIEDAARWPVLEAIPTLVSVHRVIQNANAFTGDKTAADFLWGRDREPPERTPAMFPPSTRGCPRPTQADIDALGGYAPQWWTVVRAGAYLIVAYGDDA